MMLRVSPDRQKADALRKMAGITLERLEMTDKEKYSSNSLVDYYDVTHKLMEALTLIDGIKMKGDGAHQELIDYIAKAYGLQEQTRQFLQQMREYRNQISYEGFSVHENYIRLNEKGIKEIIKALSEKLAGKQKGI